MLPKIPQNSKSGSILSAERKKDLVILGRTYDLSKLQMIRQMTDEQYSNFIASLRYIQQESENCCTSETNTQTSHHKRKKRPRTEVFEDPFLEEVSTSETGQHDLQRRYRTRGKKSKPGEEDFYDESEIEILLENQPILLLCCDRV